MVTKKDWDRHWVKKKAKATINKKRMMKILDKYSKGIVLDAGCGTGFFSKYFVNKGCKAFAVDYSNNAVSMTKSLDKRIGIIKADVMKIPSKDETFDMVFTDGLLEHFKNPGRILQEFRRVLKNDGLVATFVPNRYSYWMLVKPFLMGHIEEYRFTLKSLGGLHNKNGFKIIESGGFTVIPSKISPEFMGRYIGRILYVIARVNK